MGDALHKPNPALGALRKAPFYALEVRPSDLSSLAGLDTNARAQVMGKDGNPIPGLYAAGLDNNTIMRRRYPGGGSSLRPAMTIGNIAARHMDEADCWTTLLHSSSSTPSSRDARVGRGPCCPRVSEKRAHPERGQ